MSHIINSLAGSQGVFPGMLQFKIWNFPLTGSFLLPLINSSRLPDMFFLSSKSSPLELEERSGYHCPRLYSLASRASQRSHFPSLSCAVGQGQDILEEAEGWKEGIRVTGEGLPWWFSAAGIPHPSRGGLGVAPWSGNWISQAAINIYAARKMEGSRTATGTQWSQNICV